MTVTGKAKGHQAPRAGQNASRAVDCKGLPLNTHHSLYCGLEITKSSTTLSRTPLQQRRAHHQVSPLRL